MHYSYSIPSRPNRSSNVLIDGSDLNINDPYPILKETKVALKLFSFI